MKLFKKLIAIVPSYCLLATGALAANPVVPEEPQDWGDPIQVVSSIDETGNTVVERTYFVPDTAGSSARDSSGKGWFKNEKDVLNSKEGTMYAKGYFVWGNGDVSVSSPSGGNNGKLATVSDEDVTSGTGNYGGIFNKYAYVTYSFVTTNFVGNTQNNSVTIRVSQSGNQI